MGNGVEANLVNQYIQAGIPLPAKITEKPILRKGLQVYLEAFFNLDTERCHGESLQTIPFSSMVQYGRDYLGLDHDDLEDFLHILQRIEQDNMGKLVAERKASRK